MLSIAFLTNLHFSLSSLLDFTSGEEFSVQDYNLCNSNDHTSTNQLNLSFNCTCSLLTRSFAPSSLYDGIYCLKELLSTFFIYCLMVVSFYELNYLIILCFYYTCEPFKCMVADTTGSCSSSLSIMSLP